MKFLLILDVFLRRSFLCKLRLEAGVEPQLDRPDCNTKPWLPPFPEIPGWRSLPPEALQ
ncbi:hypothetical protein D3C71_2056600 [compost metagenome]